MRAISGVLSSVVFGAATSLINNVPGMLGEVGQAHSEDSAATWTAIYVSLILDSGWAWAALAFVLGWLCGPRARPWRAACVGAVGLIAATVAYYSTDLLFGIDTYLPTVGYWAVRAVVFGLPLGLAGAVARRPGWLGLLAALTIPVGAAMNMVVFPLRSGLPGESSAAGWAQGTVWAVAGAGAAAVVLRFVRARQSRPTLARKSRMSEAVPQGE